MLVFDNPGVAMILGALSGACAYAAYEELKNWWENR